MSYAFVTAVVLAAAPIRLEEARGLSRGNVQALTALLEVRNAEQDVRLARATLLPQVSFNTGVNGAYIGEQRVFAVVPSPDGSGFVQQAVTTSAASRALFLFGLDVNQVVYDKARWERLAQSGAVLEARKGEAREQADTSELEGIRRFFALLRTQAALKVLESNVRRSEQQLERAKALFEAGRAGRSEEIAAQVNLGNDRIALTLRQSQLVTEQGQLAIWVAKAGAEPLEAVDPGTLGQPVPALPTLEEALEAARRKRPLLVAVRERLRAAELAKSVASAGFLPRVNAGLSYSRNGPDGTAVFLDPRLQNTVSAGIQLQWDIFNGYSTVAEEGRAENQRRAAELNLAQTERELEADVRRTYEVLQAQVASAALAEVNREAAARGLTLAEERFNAGLGSTLEVRDAQLKLTQAELSLLEYRIDVEVARFALMRAMGTLGGVE